MPKPKSLILNNIEEVIRKKLSGGEPTTSKLVTLEEWLKRSAEHINKLEQDASGTITADYLKRYNYLERVIKQNREEYDRKEKKWQKVAVDLRRRLQETYEKLPLEERLNTEFTCFSCGLVWNKQFLRMTDKQGSQYCWECVNEGTETAGKDIGQEIAIESTPISPAIKTFQCEFCGINEIGKPEKWHITNAPDRRDPRKIIKLCKNCYLTKAKVSMEINYCPRRTGPCDDEIKPEYDCDCPFKEKYKERW